MNASGGEERAAYGVELLERLAVVLTAKFGRGFSRRNLQDMRVFYMTYPLDEIWRTLSAKLETSEISATASRKSQADTSRRDEVTILQARSGISVGGAIKQTLSAKFDPVVLAACFPLPWSAYVRLLSVKNASARKFYERRYSWEMLNGDFEWWRIQSWTRKISAQAVLSIPIPQWSSPGFAGEAEEFRVSGSHRVYSLQ